LSVRLRIALAAAAVLAAVPITGVALITLPVFQWLMPAINRANDARLLRRLRWPHGASVV